MAECNSNETPNMYTNLSATPLNDQQQFRLNKIKKKKKHNKVVMLARSKLNSIESKISEALINNEISYEDVMTIINEGKKF